MADERPVPAALAQAIREDLRPVRPLLPSLVRAAMVGVVSLGIAGGYVGSHGLRIDLETLPGSMFLIPLGLRLIAGAVLLLVALREGVPAAGVSRRTGTSALGVGIALLVSLPVWFALALRIASTPTSSAEMVCYQCELALGAVPLAVASWLLLRAYPIRPVFAHCAAGLGVGLIADAALFSICPIGKMNHGLIFHGGGVATLGLLGLVIGWGAWTARWRRKRLDADRESASS